MISQEMQLADAAAARKSAIH